MLWTKKAHQCTICQTFECSNESSPNTSCHFWNHKVRLYSNFASLFSVMKDNSSVFFRSNLIYFGQKWPIEVKFLDSWVCGWKFTKFLMWCLFETTSQTFNCSGEILTNLCFDLLLLLKVYKISAKKYKGVVSRDTEDRCKIWRKTDFCFKNDKCFDQSTQKSKKIVLWLVPFMQSIYIAFDLKKYKGVIFHETEESCKIWRKTDLCFGK